MRRQVTPELLDELPATDPRAVHSRRDLRRINRIMGNAAIMASVLRREHSRGDPAGTKPLTVLELGCGDGTFITEVARRLGPDFGLVEATLIDQQALVTSSTLSELTALGWQVRSVQADVFEWLAQDARPRVNITVANLFLHHFKQDRLATLLGAAADGTRLFATTEPLRSRMAFAAASLMGLIGCNQVTLHDGRVSVKAGFRDRELSALWPHCQEWRLDEHKAGLFTHLFVARRMVG